MQSCLQYTTYKYYHSQINYKLLKDKHHFGTWRNVAMFFAPALVNTLYLRSKPEKDEECDKCISTINRSLNKKK